MGVLSVQWCQVAMHSPPILSQAHRIATMGRHHVSVRKGNEDPVPMRMNLRVFMVLGVSNAGPD
jgi:hypothetical protein